MILIAAVLLFPLHLYTTIALRTASQDLLEGMGSGNRWDFGRIVAVLLLGVTASEAVGESWASIGGTGLKGTGQKPRATEHQAVTVSGSGGRGGIRSCSGTVIVE